MNKRQTNKRNRIIARIRGIDTSDCEKYKNWYAESREMVRAQYGEDYELFLKCLAATSANSSLKSNLKLARKAFAQIKNTGTIDRDGYMETHYNSLMTVIAGGMPHGRKCSNFAQNLLGNEDCVVVDVWMMRLAGIKNRKSPTPWEYDVIEAKIKAEARKYNRTPAQHQACLWAKIRGAGDSFADHMMQLRMF